MKKLNHKRSIVALCVIVPIATVCAFIPKMVKAHKNKNNYSTSI